ncbi:MAG: hypothetical protein QGD90_00295 [Candidatus Hydrogenedentes bacterium]|nr:hypothetical protein [Candidatus Hydrogenedentota bacterium]
MPRGDDVFVRFYTRFILEDPRFLRHSLTARAVFLHLSSVAVSRRSEFLPARYDAEALAISMRCSEAEVSAGLEELISAKREPLMGRLKDGRLRIVDVRKCHGTNFRWIDETDDFADWARETGETPPKVVSLPEAYPRTGTNGDSRGQQSPESRALPEVRGKREEVREQEPGAPKGLRAVAVENQSLNSPPSNHPLPGDVLLPDTLTNVTAGMIHKWIERHDFRGWGHLLEKIVASDTADPIYLLAHIIEIDNSPSILNKPATLLKRMARPSPGTKRRIPADKWQARAKELINGLPTDRPKSKSEPEQIGETLGNITDNESFDQADNPTEAARVWREVTAAFRLWNGQEPAETLEATAEARGKMLTYDGQVKVLVAIFDAVSATKAKPDRRWAAFRKKLKGRGGGSADGRRWAKTFTG